MMISCKEKIGKLSGCALSMSDLVFAWVGLLPIRIILAYEFWEAGIEKYNGSNWFGSILEKFPFPFNVVPVDISWALATWSELIGAVLLVIGLGTRFASVSLIILTIVATLSVHWPAEWSSLSELWKGYAISNKGYGNYKLPLLYLIMFVPLLFAGPGRLSIDHIIRSAFNRCRSSSSCN